MTMRAPLHLLAPRHAAKRRSQRGTAAVELGLLVLPICLIGFGTAEIGRAIHQYDTVCKTVRDAARYLSTTSGGIEGARCLALTGSPATSGTSCSRTTTLLPGLTLAEVYACDETNQDSDSRCANHRMQSYGTPGTPNAGAVNLASVTVTGYAFTSLVPFAPSFSFGPVRATMSKKP